MAARDGESTNADASGTERPPIDHQTALAEILRAISTSPGNIASTLPVIGRAAQRVCGADHLTIMYERGGSGLGWNEHRGFWEGAQLPRLGRQNNLLAEVESAGAPVRVSGPIESWEARYPQAAAVNRADGLFEAALLVVPMRGREGNTGVMSARRNRADAFDDNDLVRLQSFADQAVIAIDNAGLFRDLDAALEQQTAVAEVLRTISTAPGDIASTLPAIAKAARRLCDSDYVAIGFLEAGLWQLWNDSTEAPVRIGDAAFRYDSVPGAAYRENRAVRVDGAISAWEHDYAFTAEANRAAGRDAVAAVAVPLRGASGPIGFIIVSRDRERAFDDRHTTLLESFSDQAVIAIDNARLFADLEQRNRQVTEALQQQTANSEVLRMISAHPGDVGTVLNAIVASAAALCDAEAATVMLRRGDRFETAAAYGERVSSLVGEFLPIRAGVTSPLPMEQRAPGFTDDFLAVVKVPEVAALADRFQMRSAASVPLVHDNEWIGDLQVFRHEVRPFDNELGPILATFADQAAIAVVNAQLFNGLKEEREQQTAIAEVLRVISASPGDIERTLPVIGRAAQRLCDADHVAIVFGQTGKGAIWDPVRGFRTSAVFAGMPIARSIQVEAQKTGAPVQVVGPVSEWADRYPFQAQLFRSEHLTDIAMLCVPMAGRSVENGTVLLRRNMARPFDEREIQLLQGFADQAVIAIENAHLFTSLQTKTDELEVASRHKSEFLANMSHELRTPLNAIIGYAELLAEECEDAGTTEFLPDLGKIRSAGTHLLTLISGILDLAKVEAGRMTMYLEHFDIRALIDEVDSIVRPLVEKNGNTFTVVCPVSAGSMFADVVKTKQILFNLLSNAAKFTEGGHVELIVTRNDAGTIAFTVRDTGIGLTESQRTHLFEAFAQADVSTTRKYGGTGLGLALSKQFCLMMGGDITVQSTSGDGSTFTATLPVKVVDTEAAE